MKFHEAIEKCMTGSDVRVSTWPDGTYIRLDASTSIVMLHSINNPAIEYCITDVDYYMDWELHNADPNDYIVEVEQAIADNGTPVYLDNYGAMLTADGSFDLSTRDNLFLRTGIKRKYDMKNLQFVEEEK